MSKSDKKSSTAESKRTPARQFRLSDEVMERLQIVADDLTQTTGLEHSTADAIRVLAKQGADAVLGKRRKN